MLRKFSAFVILQLLVVFVHAESNSIADSLVAVLKTENEDTFKVNTLNELCKINFSDSPAQAMNYGIEARDLAEKIGFTRGSAYAYKNIGIVHYMQGNYSETLMNWEKSLALFKNLNDKVGESNILSNIGNVYFNNGSDERALDYFLQSLKLSEETGNKLRIATALGNIANVYLNKTQTLDKALSNFLRALPIGEELGDKNIVGSSEVGIGEIYLKKQNFDSALFFFRKSLIAYEGTEFIPYSLNDIGKVYLQKGDLDSAKKNHEQAYEIAKNIDSKLDMVQALKGLAQAEQLGNNFSRSIEIYKEAELLANEVAAKYELKEIYDGLAKSYSSNKDFKNAFVYQNLYDAVKDSIYNTETDKKLGSLQFDFDISKKQNELDKKQQEVNRQKQVRNGFIAGFAVVVIFAGIFFRQRNRIKKEKKRSDELLLNILPEEVAEELKEKGEAEAKQIENVTVLFTDFKGFTQLSEKLTPKELVAEIDSCFRAFDQIVQKHGVEKIKTIGDAYMCAGGLPVPNESHAVDTVKAALDIQQYMLAHKSVREKEGKLFFEIRIGVHTGPVVAGIVGLKKFAYDIWGDTVNTASRMESSGEVGKVNISGATYALIKDEFNCNHRGKISAKNKGEIDMYFVES